MNIPKLLDLIGLGIVGDPLMSSAAKCKNNLMKEFFDEFFIENLEERYRWDVNFYFLWFLMILVSNCYN